MGIAIVSAPTNLGLRPPQPGSVPGTAKGPEALREAGLFTALAAAGAIDRGSVIPGRYVDDYVPGSGRVRNQDELLRHALRLAERVGVLLSTGESPLVLGGDCSLLVGTGLALARAGRYGLVHLDGHTDFRHPGNSADCSSLAGEDLAAAVGLHWPALADIENRGPYVDLPHVVQLGCRDADDHLDEVRSVLGGVLTSGQLAASTPQEVAEEVRSVVAADGLDGYWVHLDVDVLDPSYLPAVDSPAPGGLSPDQLIGLLQHLTPAAAGAQVTVFDPDLDPDGRYARLLTGIVASGLADLGRHRGSA